MVAMYDYVPQKDSPNPNPDLELSFKAGDRITIYGNMVPTHTHNYHYQVYRWSAGLNNCRMATGSTVESLEDSLALSHPTFWRRRKTK